MNKTFTVTYADEPYKTTTADGNTFECTYVGPRWILAQVDRDDDPLEKQDAVIPSQMIRFRPQ